ncbi:MAG: sigma-70 family RNA polymerase sigma factor [Planctomycetaceae bacterium]|nr:sigma-70 family RNA polymerase sigma factor [Planctomycetaceae bacterium]
MHFSGDNSGGPSAGAFHVTRWSIVRAAVDRDSLASQGALQTLCETYWYPLYAYARRSGRSADDAADVTQSFFAQLLERPLLESADPEFGRFRTFLLTVFKRFLINDFQRQQAQKRGGGVATISIDSATGEQQYRHEPASNWTAEDLYERRWALTLLSLTMERLEQEYRERGKLRLFELCRPHLAGSEGKLTCAETGRELKLTEAAVRVTVHRMRARFRELLAAEIASTIDERCSIVEELEYLRSVIREKK